MGSQKALKESAMRGIISFVLMLALVVGLLPVRAAAASEDSSSGVVAAAASESSSSGVVAAAASVSSSSGVEAVDDFALSADETYEDQSENAPARALMDAPASAPASALADTPTDASAGVPVSTLAATPVSLAILAIYTVPPGSTDVDVQNAINIAASGDTIEISSDISFTTTVTIPASKTITLSSNSGNVWTLTQANVNLRHFEVSGDLVLHNIILDGGSTGGGIQVNAGGTLQVGTGSAIQACYANQGGAVFTEGNLTLSGGAISNNEAAGSGGGIYAAANTVVHIKGGSVSNNSALPEPGNFSFYGGGICTFGKLVLDDGEISENVLECYTTLPITNTSNPQGLYGGGVYAREIEMYGGEISNNRLTGSARSTQNGGGVHIEDNMYMQGGSISYNKIEAAGNGRYSFGGGLSGGNITIVGGSIHHNDTGTAPGSSRGGGIVINRGSWLKLTGGEIYENSSTWGGGIFLNAYTGQTNSVISGDTKIYQNKACYGGGVTVYNNFMSATMKTEISGTVKIVNNTASTAYGLSTDASMGGGIHFHTDIGNNTYAGVALIDAVIKDNVEISGNSSSMYAGGVGARSNISGTNASVTGVTCALTISGDVKILDNSAPTGGGVMPWTSDLLIKDRVLISGNTTAGFGAGIRQQAGTYDSVEITDQAKITNNAAPTSSGGGIYTNNLAKLKVGANVEFALNRAGAGYLWALDNSATAGDGSDSGTHMANILSTSFTAPFTNAYNNFDINYSSLSGTVVYAVNYHANGGSGTTPTEPARAAGDSFAAATNTFTAPLGMQFKEWNTQSNELGTSYAQNAAVTMTTGSLTLYAIWEPFVPTYCITYDANGGSGSYLGQALPYGGTDTVLPVSTTGISHATYTFTEWNTHPDGSAVSYAPGDVINLNGSITLYAQWKPSSPGGVSPDVKKHAKAGVSQDDNSVPKTGDSGSALSLLALGMFSLATVSLASGFLIRKKKRE